MVSLPIRSEEKDVPSILTVPESGRSNKFRILSNVDLPEPLDQINATVLPS